MQYGCRGRVDHIIRVIRSSAVARREYVLTISRLHRATGVGRR